MSTYKIIPSSSKLAPNPSFFSVILNGKVIGFTKYKFQSTACSFEPIKPDYFVIYNASKHAGKILGEYRDNEFVGFYFVDSLLNTIKENP